jgi:hypothetical protein
MWQDRWFTLGIIGALLSCLACLTPVAVIALGVIRLGAWDGHLDAIVLPVLVGSVVLIAYRFWLARRRAP